MDIHQIYEICSSCGLSTGSSILLSLFARNTSISTVIPFTAKTESQYLRSRYQSVIGTTERLFSTATCTSPNKDRAPYRCTLRWIHGKPSTILCLLFYWILIGRIDTWLAAPGNSFSTSPTWPSYTWRRPSCGTALGSRGPGKCLFRRRKFGAGRRSTALWGWCFWRGSDTFLWLIACGMW